MLGFSSRANCRNSCTARCWSMWYRFFIATLSFFLAEKPPSAHYDRGCESRYFLRINGHPRYFRCPISVPVLIRRDTMPDVCGQSINISEGGMAVSTSVQFGVGPDVQVQFPLVGQKVPFSAASTVCWRKTEHLGVQIGRAHV